MNYEFLNEASIVLGIIVMVVCIFSDIPKPYKNLTLITMPMILIVNYYSLMEIQRHRK